MQLKSICANVVPFDVSHPVMSIAFSDVQSWNTSEKSVQDDVSSMLRSSDSTADALENMKAIVVVPDVSRPCRSTPVSDEHPKNHA